MVLNLLSNAIKFAPEGGWVKINANFEEQLVIKVGNNGRPIPVDEQQKIFNRFYQAGDTRHQGAGIGLALTKEFVELCRGKIGVESTLEKGTWFWLSLPLEMASTKETAISVSVSDSTSMKVNGFNPAQEREPIYGFPENRPTLLIVEDHAEVRQYIKSKLANVFKMIEAENGQKGFELALKHIPDLIISDVMMPVMDGVSLCQKLKTDHHTDHIPVILLTAKADIESRLLGLKTGADDYLAKPFNSRELLLRCQNLVLQRQKPTATLPEERTARNSDSTYRFCRDSFYQKSG